MDYEDIGKLRKDWLYRYVTEDGEKITICIFLSSARNPIAHIFRGTEYVAFYKGQFLSEEAPLLRGFFHPHNGSKRMTFNGLPQLIEYLFPHSEYYGLGAWNKPTTRFIKSETFIN